MDAIVKTNSVFDAAYAVLTECAPEAKCQAAKQLFDDWHANKLSLQASAEPLVLIDVGRPAKPVLVPPKDLPKRSLHTDEGRIIFMHAVAHIEFNAINLACDAIYRFRDLPKEYYQDWIKVAADEARHFLLLADYLAQYDCLYGDYDAHNGLWDMAVKTANDVVARMALVPRVLEARGLDVTPMMIQKLEAIGDQAAVEILNVIYREEISHVAAGSRWFQYVCEQRDLEPQRTFFDMIENFFAGELRGPFNEWARLQAGFAEDELLKLREQ